MSTEEPRPTRTAIDRAEALHVQFDRGTHRLFTDGDDATAEQCAVCMSIAFVIDAAISEAVEQRDFEWWQELALVDNVPPEPRAVKTFLMSLYADQQAEAVEQARRETEERVLDETLALLDRVVRERHTRTTLMDVPIRQAINLRWHAARERLRTRTAPATEAPEQCSFKITTVCMRRPGHNGNHDMAPEKPASAPPEESR